MALNVVGLIGIIVFYLAILAVGLWAAFKRKKSRNVELLQVPSDGSQLQPQGETTGVKSHSEDVMLAGRDIGLFVGIMTMTGKCCVFDAIYSLTLRSV